ncbi:MAG: serine/threonine protein kinase [Proteobacteria bacterium]|nr:serine/threonine protein kinase [Pseudomonadota bacterium]
MAPLTYPQIHPDIQLLERVGIGGMGEVFKGILKGPGGFEKPIAVKTLLLDDPELKKAFLNEARILAKFSHPNIVQIFQAGLTSDNSPYLVLEWIDGSTLREIFESRVPIKRALAPKYVCEILRQALLGLNQVHNSEEPLSPETARIIHRDLSPHNLMIDKSGVVKIVDFGIAKLLKADRFTQTQALQGKLCYLAPELANGKSASEQSDLFSLGSIAYELLTGEKVFSGNSDFETLDQIKNGKVRELNLSSNAIPLNFQRVVNKLIQVDITKRFKTAKEAYQDLEKIDLFTTCDSMELAQLLPDRKRVQPQESTLIENNISNHQNQKSLFPKRLWLSLLIVTSLLAPVAYILYHSNHDSLKNPPRDPATVQESRDPMKDFIEKTQNHINEGLK